MDNAFDKNPNSRRPSEKGRNPYDGLRPWSAITHGVGIVLVIIGTVFLLMKTIPVHSVWMNIGFGVFCLTMIMLYTASTLYHSVNTTVKGRVALRKFDHMAVNFLIAGSYVPLCLTILYGTVGTVILSVIWTLAIAGALVSFFWVNSPRWVTAGIYLGLGWVSVSALPFIYQNAGWDPIIWMAAGGVAYTIGGVSYAIKWPGRNNPRFGCHEIFHVFIVIGTIFHYFMIYWYMS